MPLHHADLPPHSPTVSPPLKGGPNYCGKDRGERRLQFPTLSHTALVNCGKALLDPGLFAARYGFKGFLGLVAFAAITEAAWRSL
jgi:hypothetical protein